MKQHTQYHKWYNVNYSSRFQKRHCYGAEWYKPQLSFEEKQLFYTDAIEAELKQNK